MTRDDWAIASDVLLTRAYLLSNRLGKDGDWVGDDIRVLIDLARELRLAARSPAEKAPAAEKPKRKNGKNNAAGTAASQSAPKDDDEHIARVVKGC